MLIIYHDAANYNRFPQKVYAGPAPPHPGKEKLVKTVAKNGPFEYNICVKSRSFFFAAFPGEGPWHMATNEA